MSNHGETERSILRLFQKEARFTFKEEEYEIVLIGKPSPSKGECKTDIYISANKLSTNSNHEFKISIKQDNADFLGNKISMERAIEIFGEDASQLIKNNIQLVANDFLEDYLVYFKRAKGTEAKCLKIGWKFEFVNKMSGKRSAILELTDEQKIDIYAGTNLLADKRNSMVNGTVIENSGIANFILEVDSLDNTLDHVLNKMVAIDEFAINQEIFFACKAINYRVERDKWDGNRPLSVYVDWSYENDVLNAKLVMDRPLEVKANQVGEQIRAILSQLNIDSSNFDDLKDHLHANVNFTE